MRYEMDVKQKLDFIIMVLKKYGAKNVSLFGSYARGDFNADSDVDVLVDFRDTITLIDLAHIMRIVKEKTGLTLDLVTKNAISPYLAPYIEKDLTLLYSA